MKSSSRQRRVRPLKAKAAAADAEFDSYGAEPNMKLSHAFMVVLALHVVAVGGLFAFNKVKAGHSKVSQKVQTEVAAGQEAVAKEEAKPLAPAPVHEVVKEVKQEVAKIVEPSVSQPKVKEPMIAPAPAKKVQQESYAAPTTIAPTAPVLTPAQKQFLAAKAATTATTGAAVSSSAGAVAAVANMGSSAAVTTSESVSNPVPVTSAAMEYTIVKGDNPYKIAKRFHVPYDQLIKFNNITDPRKMQIGQKIKIPTKGTAKSQG